MRDSKEAWGGYFPVIGWMGSQFNDWTDYNGLAFAMELHRVRRMGFAQNCGGKKIQASGG